jgi:hypothetical protein
MASRAELEAENRSLAKLLDDYLRERHGERVGFTLFVFEFSEDGGNVAYISNADRSDMIKNVKAWLARVESGLTTDPPGPTAEG